ncbi:MAG: histidine acid phosphatase [Muribaculaceae bacterium]|nr:histidine acid phosphatase [Muribaculaceae bacterium]
MNIRRHLAAAAALTALSLAAGTPWEDISLNPALAGNNLLAYPDSGLPPLTPPPSGYAPFHIEHYGRHGSRWLLSEGDYTRPLHLLDSAASLEALTDSGRRLRDELAAEALAAKENYGRLTPLGAEQHRGIARRMTANFPEVFAGDARIDASSTIVPRCLLSMTNELVEIAAANPAARITAEAGKPLQRILNPCDYDTAAIELKRSLRPVFNGFRGRKVLPARLIASLVDTVRHRVDSAASMRFFNDLFEIALNRQSHSRPLLTEYFTPEELYAQWEANNARWHATTGFSPVTDYLMPHMTAPLVADIIAKADRALADGSNGATLRFGHETVLLPLTAALRIDGMDADVASLDSVADRWQAYRAFPMAGNVQIVFYRHPTLPPLVKVLLNEHEATLPVPSGRHPYYPWDGVKALWQQSAH